MKTGRSSHGCGLIKGDNGTEIVVVGGDFASGDDVEIFNINNREWRTGNEKVIYNLKFNTFPLHDFRTSLSFWNIYPSQYPLQGIFSDRWGRYQGKYWYHRNF